MIKLIITLFIGLSILVLAFFAYLSFKKNPELAVIREEERAVDLTAFQNKTAFQSKWVEDMISKYPVNSLTKSGVIKNEAHPDNAYVIGTVKEISLPTVILDLSGELLKINLGPQVRYMQFDRTKVGNSSLTSIGPEDIKIGDLVIVRVKEAAPIPEGLDVEKLVGQ